MANNELKEFDSKSIMSESIDMKKYIDELLAALKADTEVYEKLKPLGLTNKEVRENIGKIADFQCDYNVCKNCPGYDKCPKNPQHISMYVYKDGNYITTRSEPCSKLIEQILIDSKYVYMDFPKEWKLSTLKKLDLSDNRKPLIKEFVNILKGNSSRWLFLNGNHKVGKSYLLVTFANEFIANKKALVAVINATNRFKDLADLSYSDKKEFAYQLETLSKVPLLVIDDFGMEYKNEFIRDSIVIPILNERSRNSLPTMFSSDFTINEIQRLYSVGKNGGEIRGKQLGKILLEMCEKEFDLTGASIYKK